MSIRILVGTNKNIHKIKVNINRNYNYYCHVHTNTVTADAPAAGCEMFKYLQNRFCGIIIPIIVYFVFLMMMFCLYEYKICIERLRGDVI